MNINDLRTDLALEKAQTIEKNRPLPDGIEMIEKNVMGLKITDVKVSSSEAAREIGKPEGRYLTLECPGRMDFRPSSFDEWSDCLKEGLKTMLEESKKVLVVGLGNAEVTPDSLGPKVCSKILATRHLKENAPELMSEGLGEVSAISPGVMGQTGIEAQELIKSVCEAIQPDALIAVDALACCDVRHLGRTIQLTDTGISPGSGVLNARKELSRATVGRKCIAVGVPTIADTGSGDDLMMVTPRTVDKLIACTAELIASAINSALHPGLGREEIEALMG